MASCCTTLICVFRENSVLLEVGASKLACTVLTQHKSIPLSGAVRHKATRNPG